jgi:3',5'-cyclic AMP phosphodiesterase CpdA
VVESIALAHLSDIHFHHELGGDVWDLDSELRHELELDLGRVTAELGPLRALLITGDVAFSGSTDEYAAAETWLGRITTLAGCREEDVWMVPGNHDVLRRTVSERR